MWQACFINCSGFDSAFNLSFNMQVEGNASISMLTGFHLQQYCGYTNVLIYFFSGNVSASHLKNSLCHTSAFCAVSTQ
jgi:hypothetical protein